MIEVSNLTKEFGSKRAVDNLSFSVGKGEILGFLGPNGAGKSTTMRMVTGYLPPTKGSVMVGGVDMIADPVGAKQKIGYLPENAPLYPDMTVASFLGFIADLRGLSGASKKAGVERALDLCFLQPVRNQLIDTLSKGYRHRTCLAQSVLHDPDVLILDEPTDGLDPNQKHEVRSLIKRMGENKVIIFSTHILERSGCCVFAGSDHRPWQSDRRRSTGGFAIPLEERRFGDRQDPGSGRVRDPSGTGECSRCGLGR